MNTLLFYIVVPVFKAEQFLQSCVDSVLAQTYHNWELILVDDGSPDASGQICDEIASKDNRIHVIHQENKGQIAARMAGNDYVLNHLKGNSYMVYLDSDDTLIKHALETIKYYVDRDGSDIVVYSWQRIKNGAPIKTPQKPKYTGVLADKKEIYSIVFLDMGYNSMCLKSINTKLLKHEDYSKYYNIRHGEDLIQSINYYRDCNQISFTDEILYNYTINENSVTQSVDFKNFSIDPTVRLAVWEFLERECVWNGEDFSRYAKNLQTFLVQDLLKIASFPIQFKFKKSLYDNIRSNSYYNKVLTYRTSHIVIGLFKLKFDKSIVLLARIRNFISSIYHKI